MEDMNKKKMKWTTISCNYNIFRLDIFEIWRYKDLVKMFVVRDFVTFYKQTILGPLWFVIQPIFTSLMFTFVFGKVANISTAGIPHILFYMAGIINWSYFSECLIKTSDTFVVNAPIFGKVYFPRLTVPVSQVISNMIRYLIQFIIFIFVYIIFIFRGYSFEVNIYIILLTPIILIYMAVMSLGFGIWVSSLTTKYRDLRFAFPFFVQLWMYATPIIYPLSIMPENYKKYILVNPITPIIELFRKGYLGQGDVTCFQIFLSIIITTVVLITGIMIFNKIEKTFMDTV